MAIKSLSDVGFFLDPLDARCKNEIICGFIDLNKSNCKRGEYCVLGAACVASLTFSGCEIAEVKNIAADHGWGPTLYLVIIEEFKKVRPCSERNKVTSDAVQVWSKFLEDDHITSTLYEGTHENEVLNRIYEPRFLRTDLQVAKKNFENAIMVDPRRSLIFPPSRQAKEVAKLETERNRQLARDFIRDYVREKSTAPYRVGA